jgi:UDP-glucose 4-epimerase
MMDFFSLFNNKKVLITGGLGFIGSNLARTLVQYGSKITLIDSMIPEYGSNIFNVAGIEDKLQINFSDVRDSHSMKFLVKGQDYLFNLAGQTSHLDSMENPVADLEINCAAQLSILEACRHYNPNIKIVFASTRQLYGKPDYLPVDEKHPIRPVDVNGINKSAGEWYHILYNNVYAIKACVLRLTNTYGPRMRIKDARQTFLGIWFSQLLRDAPIEVWGGTQLRDFTYVDDCVSALLMCAAEKNAVGKVYNLGGIEVISLEKLAQLCIKVFAGGRYIVKQFPKERRKIDIGNYYSDFGLIRKEIGWEPKISLEAGIERTLSFYKDNFSKYQR